MPANPNPYVSKVMTNFVQERSQDFGADAGYVGQKLMPWVPVKGHTGIYYTKNSVFFKRLPDNYTTRGSKSPTQTLPDWSTDDDTYKVSTFALAAETAVEDLDRTEKDVEIVTRQSEVVRVEEALYKEHEHLIHDIVTDDSIYAATNVKQGVAAAPGTNEFLFWDDADAEPLRDIESWCTELIKVCGKAPNFIVIPKPVFSKSKFLAKFLQPTYQVQLNILTREHFKDYFDIPTVFVPQTIWDDEALGVAADYHYIWGNEILLGYLPEMPSKKTRAFGYTFTQTDVEGGMPSSGFRVRSHFDPMRGSGVYVDAIEGFVDRRVCDASLFMLVKEPITPANIADIL